ncbi:MAG: nuclear transport factor 2 family protein [Acidobacteriia bacterium]|nr:nuclear transport factor 2 family protein [Terriglobia bacterium]
MLRIIFIGTLVLGMLLLVAAQHRPQAGADETLILALESAWNQAELHHDAKAAADIMADTFISVDHHGKLLNKAQYLADLKDETFRPEQISNENPKVYMYGNTAIVTSAYRTKGTDSGQPFVHHGRFTDTWVKLDGKWICVADQETLIGK